MDLKLRTAFKTLDGRSLSTLTLRDYLTVGDVLDAEREGGDSSNKIAVVLVAKVAGLDVKEVHSLDTRDFDDISDHVIKIRERDPKD